MAELPGRGTLEVLAKKPDHVRLPTLDAEVVQVCADLDDIAPATASIATGDLHMKVRTRCMDVRSVDLPEERRWLLPAREL